MLFFHALFYGEPEKNTESQDRVWRDTSALHMDLDGFKFFKGASVNEKLCACLLNDNSVGEQLNGACVVNAGQIDALYP